MPLPLYSPKPVHPLSKVKYIVGIAAGKGGVGKSTLTVNLGLALKTIGFQVGIMDTDIYGPSIRRMLPEDRLPSQKGEVLFPALCKGIQMISMAYFRREHEAAAVRAPIANGLIFQFIKNVQWGELDFLLIDFPPGTGDVQLTLSQHAHLTGAIMVTTPQEVALMDVRKAAHLFHQVKVPLIGIVENMSYYQHSVDHPPLYLFGKGGGERLAYETGSAFLGNIPIDPLLCENGDKGLSLFEQDPNMQKDITKVFIKLAEQLAGHVRILSEQSNLALNQFELVWKEV